MTSELKPCPCCGIYHCESIPIAELEAFIEENKDEYLSSDDIIGFSIEVYDLQALIDKYKL